MRAAPALALVVVCLAACPKSAAPPDAGVDAGSGPLRYDYQAAPAPALDAGLDPATWKAHLVNDLLPYWTMAAAQGAPTGNFPTNRGMDGSPSGSTDRKPRMMGRQIFAYSVGFLLTGDEALLDLARAGDRWLLDHAWQGADGGWAADLDVAGAVTGTGPKFAQDFAYAAMGPAAYFYVTRDAEAEGVVLATRDLLFDPRTFWDADGGRVKDGLDPTLTTEAYMDPGGPGSWQLVAQLDPVTAFLLLVQPHLTDDARRQQVLDDLQRLTGVVQQAFWRSGFFWGATGTIGQWGSQHSDFGHMLKSYWALLQVDKRLPSHPYAAFLGAHAADTLRMAYDAPYGRWAKYPTSASSVAYGSDWWAYAEGDQLAGSLALHDPSWLPVLGLTATHFRGDYVDRTRAAREVVSSVGRDGAWVYPWPDADTSKCNVWKNGFHSSEHALVMSLISSWVQGVPLELYFAFPGDQVAALAGASWPYTFPGRVVDWTDLGPLAGDATRHKVKVRFDQLR
jgi:N-acylglucosamine 2-epimerase (GlcNAc 2-epimerase)